MEPIPASITNEEWNKIGAVADHASMNMLVSLVESDVMEYIENKRSVSLDALVRDLTHPGLVTAMSVGALVRDGLVRLLKDGDHIQLESV